MEGIQGFIHEKDFEEALIAKLLRHGWNEVIDSPTEDDLIRNWADIIYANNRDINRLGNWRLTDTEMQQILDMVNLKAGDPCEMNRMINGCIVGIRRDHPQDVNNRGKTVYLKIFDPREISAGQSRYQIARQPQFATSVGDRRGDLTLLINGMPVVHIELKRSGIDVSQACYQIKRYAHEGVFSHGMYSMVQIFVAMTPENTRYFANPGREERYNQQFYFHWADFNNVEIHDWQKIASDLLSIPMAHQLLGYYTIADRKDGVLKVLRSYQYFAASKISDTVSRTKWDAGKHMGGFVWHTTGSGKTMTSFKSAQLIAASGDADKVVFLLDRIELAIQTLDEFRGFTDDDVQDTSDSAVLLEKLKSNAPDDRLIVTSIQKMGNLAKNRSIAEAAIKQIDSKRLVLIVDECHRSVFGEMLMNIKRTFPRALLFGFTGTPVFPQNARGEITTETIFGNMLHKYTIADGIPDGNVLGFDPYRVSTYQDDVLREKAAFNVIVRRLKDDDPELDTTDWTTEDYLRVKDENTELKKIYERLTDKATLMADTYTDSTGKEVHGVEHYLPKDIYKRREHRRAVMEDIVKCRPRLSMNGKFHAMLATQSISAAIDYYKLFKEVHPSLRVAAVFDNNIDNNDDGIAREDAIVEMLNDYNRLYDTAFTAANYAQYKKDVALRLAHKKHYSKVPADKQIDLLIVVSQMLTGYDSKWINTLYVDKKMVYVDIIQAFSRTNRLMDESKKFGTIKYYSYPYTMKHNIDAALEIYACTGFNVFVDKLEQNLNNVNLRFLKISDIFRAHGISNFSTLPEPRETRNMFAKCFREMSHMLEAAKMQGFDWSQKKYEFPHEGTPIVTTVEMLFDEETFLTLRQRYKELFEKPIDPGTDYNWEYAIDTYLTETGTGTIDAEYINSHFRKFVRELYTGHVTRETVEQLCKSFASLPQRDQRTAGIILRDIQRGELRVEEGKSIQDYINIYQQRDLEGQVEIMSRALEIDYNLLKELCNDNVNEQSINEFNRYGRLTEHMDRSRARELLGNVYGTQVPPRAVMSHIDRLLRRFIFDTDHDREDIIAAVTCDGRTLDDATAQRRRAEVEERPLDSDKIIEQAEAVARVETELSDEERLKKIKEGVAAILSDTLAPVSRYMRAQSEVIDSVFSVLDRVTGTDHDSVRMLIDNSFNLLFVKDHPTIVDKHVAYNCLVMRFEAYLKKLYYLMEGREVQAMNEGEPVTWKNVIYAVRPLWNLKYSRLSEYQVLYEWLCMVKDWRNGAAHSSLSATEAELDWGNRIIVTMYFYATGACITELESAHDSDEAVGRTFTPRVNRSADHTEREAAEGDTHYSER